MDLAELRRQRLKAAFAGGRFMLSCTDCGEGFRGEDTPEGRGSAERAARAHRLNGNCEPAQ